MDQKIVNRIEHEIEKAIEEAMARLQDDLPFTPSRQIQHLMAQAATAVYEAAFENFSRL